MLLKFFKRKQKNPDFHFTVVRNSPHNSEVFLYKNQVKVAKFTVNNYSGDGKIVEHFENLVQMLRP